MTLVSQPDIEASLLRPLTSVEAGFISAVIAQAESKLRIKLPNVDALITAYSLDPRPRNSLDPVAVAGMLADVIKRRLTNPKGLWSTSETDGDYTLSETYPGSRAGAGAAAPPGDLEITAADLASLFPTPVARVGTMRLRPALAPPPCGRYG